MSFLILFAAAAVAFALSTICGGGAGLLLLPVLARLLPATLVPAALTLGTATSTISKLVAFWRHVRWDVASIFVPAALPGVVIGALVLRRVNPLLLEVFIGLFLLSNVRTLLRPSALPPGADDAVHPPPSKLRLAGVGALAGLLSGLTGAVGVLFNDFYFRYGLKRDEIIATRAANEVLLHGLKLFLYVSFGLVTREVLLAGTALAAGALFATGLARGLVSKLPEAAFRRLGYGTMVVSGVFMLGSAVQQIRRSPHLTATVLREPHEMELTGAWAGGSVSVEWEYGEGVVIEHAVPPAEVPAAVLALAEPAARGRPLVKAEAVYGFRERAYELSFRDGTGTFTIEVRVPR